MLTKMVSIGKCITFRKLIKGVSRCATEAAYAPKQKKNGESAILLLFIWR